MEIESVSLLPSVEAPERLVCKHLTRMGQGVTTRVRRWENGVGKC